MKPLTRRENLMRYLPNLTNALTTSITLTFLGFGIIGTYDAVSSGIPIRNALPTFAMFGVAGALLACCLTAALPIWRWISAQGRVPLGAGLYVSVRRDLI